MTQQKSISNFTSTSIAQVIALLCQLVILKTLTNQLGVDNFGIYSLIIVVPALILPIVFSEIISATSRYFFEDNKYKLYLNALVYLFIAFIFLLVVLLLFKNVFNNILKYFDIITSEHTLFLALVSHFFIYLHSLTSSFYKINYQPKHLITQSILLNIPKAIILVFTLSYFEDKIFAVFLIFSIVHLISYLLTSLPILIRSKLDIDFKLIKRLLSYSVWLIPGSYFGTIINSSDRIIIKALSNISNVGIYSLGYKVGDLIRQFFVVSFASVLGPIKYNTKVNSDNYNSNMNNLLITFIALGLILALCINSVANILILIISNSSFLAANYVIPFILLAHIVWGLNDFLNTGYLLSNKTRITSLILLIGAAANLALNFVLIPRLGIVGASLSTAIAYLLSLPVSYHYSKKNHPLRFALKTPSILIALFSFIASLQTYVNNLNMGFGQACGINILLSLLFSIICYILLTEQQKNSVKNFGLNLLRKND